jgi:purine-binding chemotaxis protein CheW
MTGATAETISQDDPGAASAETGVEPEVRGGKYLTFFLANEEYGLEILKVQEIIGMMEITVVPGTPEFVRGVINLRGKVIPVMDLRLKFGMPSVAPTDETCIIVIQIEGVQMGVVVDRVSEVLDIPGRDIEDTPSFGAEVDSSYILGIGKCEGTVKLLLDIDDVLADRGTVAVQSMADAGDDGSGAGGAEPE